MHTDNYLPGERPKQGLKHQKYEKRRRNWRFRELPYDDSTKKGESEARPKRPEPWTQWAVTARPARGQVPTEHLEGKVDEYRDSKVLLTEALLDHLKRSCGIVRRPANFSEQVHTEGRLNVYKQSGVELV